MFVTAVGHRYTSTAKPVYLKIEHGWRPRGVDSYPRQIRDGIQRSRNGSFQRNAIYKTQECDLVVSRGPFLVEKKSVRRGKRDFLIAGFQVFPDCLGIHART